MFALEVVLFLLGSIMFAIAIGIISFRYTESNEELIRNRIKYAYSLSNIKIRIMLFLGLLFVVVSMLLVFVRG